MLYTRVSSNGANLYTFKTKILKPPEEDMEEFSYNFGKEKEISTMLQNTEITKEKIDDFHGIIVFIYMQVTGHVFTVAISG